MANTKEPKKLIIVDGESKYSLDLTNTGGGGSAELPVIKGYFEEIGGVGRLFFNDTIEVQSDFMDIENFVFQVGSGRETQNFYFYRVKLSDEEGYVYLFVKDDTVCIIKFEDAIYDRGVSFKKVGGSTVDLSDYAKKTDVPKIWKGLHSQYDALGTYDADTLYFVVENNPETSRGDDEI